MLKISAKKYFVSLILELENKFKGGTQFVLKFVI